MVEITEAEIMNTWKNNNVVVSIDTLSYNHAKYISQCLDGLLKQRTNFAFEILVCDDASTDDTAKLIHEYEEKYPNIVVPLYQKENKYSKGIKMSATYQFPRAKGKYIAICEGDDYWIYENKLQMQVDFLEKNSEYGMCYTNFNIYYQNKKKFEYDLFTTQSEKFLKQYDSLEQWILKKGYIAPMTWVFRKSLIDNYDSMNSCDGTYVLVAHFMANSKILYLDKTTATYRVLEESASHSKSLEKLYKRHKNLREVQYKLIDKYNLDNSLKSKVDEDYCRRGIKLFVALNKKEDIDLCNKFDWNFINKMILFCSKNTLFCNFFKLVYKKLRLIFIS